MAGNRDIIPAPDRGEFRIASRRRSEDAIPDRAVMGRPMQLGWIARLRNGQEISRHIYTMLRQEHIDIEFSAAMEAVAVTLLHGGKIRIQVAHRGGEFVREIGPESAAYYIAGEVMEATYGKVDETFDELENEYRRQTIANLRRS